MLLLQAQINRQVGTWCRGAWRQTERKIPPPGHFRAQDAGTVPICAATHLIVAPIPRNYLAQSRLAAHLASGEKCLHWWPSSSRRVSGAVRQSSKDEARRYWSTPIRPAPTSQADKRRCRRTFQTHTPCLPKSQLPLDDQWLAGIAGISFHPAIWRAHMCYLATAALGPMQYLPPPQDGDIIPVATGDLKCSSRNCGSVRKE